MPAIWYQCEDCIFGSNSEKKLVEHAEFTGHTYFEESD